MTDSLDMLPEQTGPDALRAFRKAIAGHPLTVSEKGAVLIVLDRCADEMERLARENTAGHNAMDAMCKHVLDLESRAERDEAELDDAKRMIWCLLRSHGAPMIVTRKAMAAYSRKNAALVRRDLPNGQVEFRAVLDKQPVEG